MDELTVEQMEAHVMAAWNLVIMCDGSYRGYLRGTILVQIANHTFEAFSDWGGAYAFTKAREAEVLERREEIAEQARVIRLARVYRRECIEAVHERILKRLQASLAELQRGMKEA